MARYIYSFDVREAFTYSLINACFNLVACIIMVSVMDWVGRRPVVSDAGPGISLTYCSNLRGIPPSYLLIHHRGPRSCKESKLRHATFLRSLRAACDQDLSINVETDTVLAAEIGDPPRRP
jgi:hypothetical protein